MRPGEFWEALRAYEAKISADRRHLGELVRGATLRLWNLQVTGKSRITDPKRFWPMPWDEGGTEEDEIQRLASLSEDEKFKEAEKFFKKVKNGKREETGG